MEIQTARRISVVSPAQFQAEIQPAQQPVVIEGALAHWPALERWTADYLLSTVGERSATCMEAGPDDPDGHFSLGKWSTSPTLDRPFVEWTVSDFVTKVWQSDHPRVYLRTTAPEILDPLAADFPAPDYVTQQPRHWKMLWMGAAGSFAPPHYDSANILHAVVRGKKRFVIFDRNHLNRVYPHGIFSGYFPHTSKVPDLEKADLKRFPRLRGLVGYEAILEPGDMLFVPTSWWHQVNTLEPSMAISYWWPWLLPPLNRLTLRRKTFDWYHQFRKSWRKRWTRQDPGTVAASSIVPK